MRTVGGTLYCFVGHALDVPKYGRQQVIEVWNETAVIQQNHHPPNANVVWMVDANLTMGSVQSEATGSYHPESESEAGAGFHS